MEASADSAVERMGTGIPARGYTMKISDLLTLDELEFELHNSQAALQNAKGESREIILGVIKRIEAEIERRKERSQGRV